MIDDKIFYFATPYQKYYRGLRVAYDHATKYAALLIASDINVFSPIVHGHRLSTFIREFDWLRLDFLFLKRFDGLIICETMSGWDESYGIAEETKFAEQHDIPIFHFKGDPVFLKIELEAYFERR